MPPKIRAQTTKKITDSQEAAESRQKLDIPRADHTEIIKNRKKQHRKDCASEKQDQSRASQTNQLKNRPSQKAKKDQNIGYDSFSQILKNCRRHQKTD